jgi:hypothetical protein
MTNRIATFFGTSVLLGLALLTYGCSSSGGAAGSGGSTGTATGGSTGAGSGGAGGAVSIAPVGDPCVGVSNNGPCTAEPACFNTCGPNKSGTKNCTCSAGIWSCPVCAYDPAKDYTCYKIPTTIAACPPDATDTSGMMLPASGGACTLAPCKPCGSGTANAYRDSKGVPKIGYCICVPSTDGTTNVYSCASTKEWAPQ